jgi:basic membrane protein A
VLAVAAIAFTGVAGCGDDNGNGEETVKAGFVYLSPPGDLGWTYAHDQGRKAIELALDNVETKYVENVAEEPDAVQAAIDELKDWGAGIIFSTSFGFMDPTLDAAGANPDIVFEHCSGYKTADNMSNYFGRIYQARYLTGIVAGRMTTANQIGYVAAFPIPEVVRGINAFTLGVRSVNPDATVHVEWTFTWYDPTLEGNAAETLLNAGADVMAQHQDSTAMVDKAEEHGAYAIGYDADMLPFGPDTVLTSAIWNWGVYYTDRVRAVQDGTWTSHSYWGSITDGIVDLGEYGAMVEQSVKDEVAAKRADLENGTWDVFDGEIKRQDGTVWIPTGSSMTDEDKLGMLEFVEGVVGEVPD